MHDEPAPPVLPLLRRPEVAWFFASIFFTVLAHTSLYAFFSLYLVSLGYGKAAVGALWAVAVAVEIVFFWFQGRWFARLSRARAGCRWWRGVTALRFVAIAGGGALAAGAGAGADCRTPSPLPPTTRPASRWCTATFPAGCAAAGRRCTRRWATASRACWAAWAAAG